MSGRPRPAQEAFPDMLTEFAGVYLPLSRPSLAAATGDHESRCQRRLAAGARTLPLGRRR
ncbi:hypothetical protein N657DRAFT_638594 [Parathielavia appendiculata]|uniref:Uncharacterized protein n=1 Tax=Parathielavia appendiculata TaxID=2587402 RepID=A0AAN6Z7R1_9PEZI|nr:hypothetical protein N657DRAFT_638594 [Parathielavia appendiculata]